MSAIRDLFYAFEVHSPEKIQSALNAGASASAPIDGTTPLVGLTEMYTRSERFQDCVRVLLNAGARCDDPALQSILLDEPIQGEVPARMSMRCTFTPLKGVSPLHVCAEYNSLRCAKALLKAGADVNARADLDAEGLGGHTPIFHTVNSRGNFARPMMELLLDYGADVNLQVKGLIWGEEFEWETSVFDVTPISYAQCGLIRQFQREEADIYSNIARLQQHRDGNAVRTRNVPNRYLKST